MPAVDVGESARRVIDQRFASKTAVRDPFRYSLIILRRTCRASALNVFYNYRQRRLCCRLREEISLLIPEQSDDVPGTAVEIVRCRVSAIA